VLFSEGVDSVLMRSSRLIALAIAAAMLTGCMQTGSSMFARNAPPPWQQPMSQPAAMQTAPLRPVLAEPAAPIMAEPAMPQPIMAAAMPEDSGSAYTLDSGDKLRVVVFGQDGLSSTYSVDPSGRITMPLIGAVHARGMTTAGLQQAIVAKLKNGYVREPHVAVEVDAYRPFFILGEVTLPGQYPYVPNMSVETAVAIAGGYTPRAFKYRIEVSRPVNGMIERKVVSATYPVRPGDTINISERWF
jgi:polysaccharide biosynthesis/export protein